MGNQYSFKTTRRTTYLDDVMEQVPKKDRSETLRQAVTLGFIQMGLLSKDTVTPLGVTIVEQTSNKSPTIVPQTLDESPMFVEQTVNERPTIATPPPSIKKVEGTGDNLDDALDKMGQMYD